MGGGGRNRESLARTVTGVKAGALQEAPRRGRVLASTGHMFSALLMSIIVVPVLAGVFAASKGRRSTALPLLLGFTFLYSLFYISLLYYVRFRWVG